MFKTDNDKKNYLSDYSGQYMSLFANKEGFCIGTGVSHAMKPGHSFSLDLTAADGRIFFCCNPSKASIPILEFYH